MAKDFRCFAIYREMDHKSIIMYIIKYIYKVGDGGLGPLQNKYILYETKTIIN